MVPMNSTFIRQTQNYFHHGPPKLQNAINEIQSMALFIIQKDPSDKRKVYEGWLPITSLNSVVNEFQKGKECGDESFINPSSLFEIAEPFISIETTQWN